MFVPELYRSPDPSWPMELIRTNPLALLVTNGPYATHLPTILEEDGKLPGGRVLGHLNRKNPHWTAIRQAGEALLVFQGPHGYVSPTVYRTSSAAPTWNFTAVHVRGRISLIDSPEETLEVVVRTVRCFERQVGTGWDPDGSLDYFRQMLPNVGAFALEIDTVDTMLKLSQEKTSDIRERVIQSFSRSDAGSHRELAAMMRRVSPR